MILVVGRFRLPSERCEEAQAAMARVIAKSRAEPGCIDYAYSADVLEPGLFRVVERWQRIEDLRAHFVAPHMECWRREREELGITDREVTAFDVDRSISL